MSVLCKTTSVNLSKNLDFYSSRHKNVSSKHCYGCFNPFRATGFFRYPLKTSEKLWFSDVFRGNQKRPVA